jgi:quercetin dioxygenase-like cupin family protein
MITTGLVYAEAGESINGRGTSRMKLLHVCRVALGTAILSGLPLAVFAKEPATVVVTPMLSKTETPAGQPIVLPPGAARVIVSKYTIAPGARLPDHRHRFPRYAYVLQGSLRVTDKDRGRSFDYKTGDFAIEVVNDLHYGVSTGTVPLKLLVIDFVPKADTGNTVMH